MVDTGTTERTELDFTGTAADAAASLGEFDLEGVDFAPQDRPWAAAGVHVELGFYPGGQDHSWHHHELFKTFDPFNRSPRLANGFQHWSLRNRS